MKNTNIPKFKITGRRDGFPQFLNCSFDSSAGRYTVKNYDQKLKYYTIFLNGLEAFNYTDSHIISMIRQGHWTPVK